MPVSPRGRQLLQLAHLHPGLTRARAASLLGVGSGTVTGLVNALSGAGLLDERPAEPSGARGRPTRTLVPHARGPLVLAALVTHEDWRVSVVQVTGRSLAGAQGVHGGDAARMVRGLTEAAARFDRRFPGRVRGFGIALPGPVTDNRVLDAPNLGWQDLDLRAVWPDSPPAPGAPPAAGVLLVAGNDASLAAVGEARRGAAVGAGLHLHLHLDAGLGGALTVRGQVLGGSHDLGGEFGHMPFGDPAVRCPCGASGCWTTAVGASALARSLGEPLPPDAVTFTRAVLDRATAGDQAARAAGAQAATALGRGIAGLVNGLDPELVTLGGLAPRLVETAPEAFEAAVTGGLMQARHSTPPPVRPSELAGDAPLVGAAEQVWSQIWPDL